MAAKGALSQDVQSRRLASRRGCRLGVGSSAVIVVASVLAVAVEGLDTAADTAALAALLAPVGEEAAAADGNEFCSDWAARGECEGNPEYMLMVCARSCQARKASACTAVLGGLEVRALRLLAEQAGRAIDYKALGLGWRHPTDRRTYREGAHPSFLHPASVERSRASLAGLRRLCSELAGRSHTEAAQAIVEAFAAEIGAEALQTGTLEGVLAALEAELLMPLRALNEGGAAMHKTMNNAPLPADEISAVVAAITSHVLRNTFSHWRYSNPVGQRQLEGLASWQLDLWREASATRVGALRVHEDEEHELGLFWATKIGGPSHGFDFEGQCILPLLANARHKVVLLSDAAYPHHPVGRAHLRLLWTAEGQQPLLWLEEIHSDFRADLSTEGWREAVLAHLVSRSTAMGVMLSCEPELASDLSALAGPSGTVRIVQDRLVLRPSNGVVEASDFLTGKHDWVQTSEETTEPLHRAVFVPEGARRSEL